MRVFHDPNIRWAVRGVTMKVAIRLGLLSVALLAGISTTAVVGASHGASPDAQSSVGREATGGVQRPAESPAYERQASAPQTQAKPGRTAWPSSEQLGAAAGILMAMGIGASLGWGFTQRRE
jgi:hypothetical protein